MHSSRRKTKFIVSVLAALAVMVAVGVAPALAEHLPAKYSGTSMKLTTTGVTVEKNGSEPKTCTLKNGATSGNITSENTAWLVNEPFPIIKTAFNCTGSTILKVDFIFNTPYYDTTTSSYIVPREPGGQPMGSPWGNYLGTKTNQTWVNGSGSTPSTLTFTKAQIGLLESTGEPITLTGTFNATTSSGGLLTLSH